MDWLASWSRLVWPSVFCGKRELKPMMERTFSKDAVWIWSFWVETSHWTPSLQGGVVRDPE